jgi:hypothetical protein
MADTKISALPASTTPLAGTEVLPIVQSGATKQVSVANLTAGRAISATQLTLTTGNVIVANGQGVDFSATPGTGTSELLADYEEGTWTPSLGGTATYFTQSGSYTKVGRLVFVRGVLVINAVGTGTTQQISGLPFANASGAVCAISVGSFFGSATAVSSFFARVSNGGSVIDIGSLIVAGTTEGTNAIFTNNTQFQFSGCYSV